MGFPQVTNFPSAQAPIKVGTQEVGAQSSHTQNYHKTSR